MLKQPYGVQTVKTSPKCWNGKIEPWKKKG